MNSALFSSNSSVWSTPQSLFNDLDREFHFDLDVCALPENAKCCSFFTPDIDGLKQPWSGVCWCNPPYGRDIRKWVEKAFFSNTLVVMLLPARTDTIWFHSYIYDRPNVEIRFLKGRLKFGSSNIDAPFPSMIVIFYPS